MAMLFTKLYTNEGKGLGWHCFVSLRNKNYICIIHHFKKLSRNYLIRKKNN